jgi:group II intron reverse transcriptase/maturase
MSEAKPYAISKQVVWEAYLKVKANHGAAGVDGQSIEAFETDLKGNLYKIWNRMSSGSYFPPPVRLVEIPKASGGSRPLGIPTVGDRVAQMVVKMHLEPLVEPHFHPDSYGYRPGRSALDAVATARERCWRSDWVIDLDIKGFFDNLDHELVMKTVRHHAKDPWILLYIERWLRAPVQKRDGSREERTKGSPQGSVVSPLLANLFMHYAFDLWMTRTYPDIRFERYADDVIIHAKSRSQAENVLEAVRQRLKECRLELHPEKTKIVYCQDDGRRGQHEHIKFDFLGYTFRPRRAKNRRGKFFVSFLPAISDKAAKAIRETIRDWRLAATRNNQSLEEIAGLVNPSVRGWANYYGRFYRSALTPVLRHLERALVRWARRKYKRLRRHSTNASHWLGKVSRRDPNLLVLWQIGIRPATGS